MQGKNLLQTRGEIDLLQLTGTHIHAHRNIQPALVPGLDLLQRLADHPLPHLGGQGVVLDHRKKHGWKQHPLFGMSPADQGFRADHPTGAHVDLGLVVEHELVVFKRLANPHQAFMAAAHAAVLIGIENLVAILARQLGLVHRLIRLTQQLIGIHVVVLRVERDAQAGRHLQHVLPDPHRLRRGIEQAIQHGQAGRYVVKVDQHHDELVAAEPCQRISLAQGLAHAAGQRNQQLVACFMAVGIVDTLESVEVEIPHRQQLFAPERLGHRLAETIPEQDAVGQHCQQIEMRHVFELLLMLLHRGDVGEQRHVMHGPALRVAHGADGEQFRIQLAILATIPDLAIPITVIQQIAPHCGIELGFVVARLDDPRILAERLLAAVAGDAGECLIDVDDRTVGRGDRDAFPCVREHAGSQQVLAFRFLAFRYFRDHTEQATILTPRIDKAPRREVSPKRRSIDAAENAILPRRKTPPFDACEQTLKGLLAIGRGQQRDVVASD